MDDKLFRQESLDARNYLHAGNLRLAKLPAFRQLTIISIGSAILLAIAAALIRIEVRTEVPGILLAQAGATSVLGSADGTVLKLHVHEGQSVEPGSPIADLSADMAVDNDSVAAQLQAARELQRDSAQAGYRAELDQLTQKEAYLRDQVRAARSELGKANEEAALLEERADAAKRSAVQFAELASDGVVTAMQATQKNGEYLDLLGRLKSLQRGSIAINKEASRLTSELNDLDTQRRLVEARFAERMAEIRRNAISGQPKLWTITAQVSGSIAKLHVKAGQNVAAGQSLAEIHSKEASKKRHQIQAFAFGATPANISVGQAVKVLFPALPYQRYGIYQGRITRIYDTPMLAKDLPPMQRQMVESYKDNYGPIYPFEIELQELDATRRGGPALRVGLRAEIIFVHEEMNLIQIIFHKSRRGAP